MLHILELISAQPCVHTCPTGSRAFLPLRASSQLRSKICTYNTQVCEQCYVKDCCWTFALHSYSEASKATHTLALLPLVKRQVFCVRDRLKMDKHKAWATTIAAPKSVGSMTTKGQMKPTCRVSLRASQAGENSQSNVP